MRWGSGQVVVIERKRGRVWYARYRLPSGRQVQKMLGPAWEGRGRPATGYFTKRLAEDWLRNTLHEARRSAGPLLVGTGATFADAAQEYLRYAQEDRGCKPSTIRGYRSQLNAHLLPRFGSMRIEDITEREIELWRSGISGRRPGRQTLSNKTKNHQLVLMHAILRRAAKLYGLPVNPAANIERFRVRSSGDIAVFSVEEVWRLVSAATSQIDGALFLTAAFTGLRRGELMALRWRDIDREASRIRVRASYASGQLSTPKSGKVRSVPMAPDVGTALARLSQRERFNGEDGFVFADPSGLPLNADRLSARYKQALEAAGLRQLRFHDLRHTFGTRVIREADVRRVQEWMGHADIQTTMKYLHYESREDEVELVARAFRAGQTATSGLGNPTVTPAAHPALRDDAIVAEAGFVDELKKARQTGPSWNRHPSPAKNGPTHDNLPSEVGEPRQGVESPLPDSGELVGRSLLDELMTAREIAEFLQMRLSTVEGYARSGILPSVKLGRHRRFVRSEVEESVARLVARPQRKTDRVGPSHSSSRGGRGTR